MAASNQSDTSSERSSSVSSFDSDNEGDYGNVYLQANAPYQHEPLAVPGEPPAFHFEEDPDQITPDVLAAREEGRITLENWCKCGKCRTEQLVGAREYRCCVEVREAGGKLVFEGREDISCITQHEDFGAVTNTTVLEMTAPLLKDKDVRPYKQRAGKSKEQFLRAVAYRWTVRWIFGYLGWDSRRPLPACVYTQLRQKYPTNAVTGYAAGQD